MRFFLAMIGAISLVALPGQPVLAQAPSQASGSQATGQDTRPSLQDDFNKAVQAAGSGDCATALPILARLAADPRVKPASLAAGMIALKQGTCLFYTDRNAEVVPLIQSGITILDKAGPDFAVDVASAEVTLGRVAVRQWQHDAAVARFQSALKRVAGEDRLAALMELAKVTSFDSGAEPLAYVDEAIGIVGEQNKENKDRLAAFHSIRGRILMNQGRDKEALVDLKEALRLSGGLTTRISLSEVAMRSDLAQAALLTGDKDKARLYLAYTGSGRFEESPFGAAAHMAPPECGSETGLRPEDVAIVEFGIADNGDIIGAQTVYSRGDYAVATAFAQAVSNWYWRPEDVAKVPAFYKVLIRVELRCSNRGGTTPGILTPLRQRFAEWAGPRLPRGTAGGLGMGAAMEQLAAIAEEREKAGDFAAAIAAIGALSCGDPRTNAATVAALDHAIALTAKTAVPTEVVNALRIFRGYAAVAASRRSQKDDTAFMPDLMALASDPQIALDALAKNTLLLEAAPQNPPASQYQTVRDTLSRVANDGGLPAHHPLRQLALLRLADLAVTQSDFDAAQAYFQQTGLEEQQCALIGAKPAMRSTGVTGADYPLEALHMGFEGWVRLEFDIGSDGRTANARPVIAYPPFVFVDAAQGMAKDIRYTASFRPSGGTACAANQEMIRFIIPAKH